MPVELLNDEQVAAYDQWIGPKSRAQLCPTGARG
jgi:hypothetical protein